VANHCDNCKNHYNPAQENCNVELDAREGKYPFVGDVCDAKPCALVSQAGFAPGTTHVAKLEFAPLVLPFTSAGGNLLGNPNVTPLSTVGNSFCPCGQNDGLFRQPYECEAFAVGRCTIAPEGYSQVDAPPNSPLGNWHKPELHPVSSTNTPWNPGAPDLDEVVFPSVNPSPDFPYPALDNPPSYAHWKLAHEVSYGSFPGEDNKDQICNPGQGIQGVFWTSVRNVSNLRKFGPNFSLVDIPPSDYVDVSSHYEYGQWGTQTKCVATPYKLPPFDIHAICLLCGCPTCGFTGLPNFSIYINPGDLVSAGLWASDGVLNKRIASLPVGLREIWGAGNQTGIYASDAFHTNVPGADFATVSLADLSITAAVRVDRDSLHLVRGGRSETPSSRGESGPQAFSQTNALAPSPGESASPELAGGIASRVGGTPLLRQQFASALSKKKNLLFLAGGVAGGVPQNDLWQIPLEGGSWEQIMLAGPPLGRIVALTYHGPEQALFAIEEKKDSPKKLTRMRLLKIDPAQGAYAVLGEWPRIGLFDEYFLSVAQSGDLMLAASRGKSAKGAHLIVLFTTTENGLFVRWMKGGKGQLASAPALSNNGLTRDLVAPTPKEPRFLPTHELPKSKFPKGPKNPKPGNSPKQGDHDDFYGCFLWSAPSSRFSGAPCACSFSTVVAPARIAHSPRLLLRQGPHLPGVAEPCPRKQAAPPELPEARRVRRAPQEAVAQREVQETIRAHRSGRKLARYEEYRSFSSCIRSGTGCLPGIPATGLRILLVRRQTSPRGSHRCRNMGASCRFPSMTVKRCGSPPPYPGPMSLPSPTEMATFSKHFPTRAMG
jgi:hypothetical protein